jgi:hypothetical protein
MSRRSLQNFLQKLENELDKDNNYRKLVSDVKAHQFYITKKGLLDQALFQAEQDGVARSKGLIQKATDQYFKDIVAGFNSFDVNRGPKTIIVFAKKVTANSFSITFQADMAEIQKVSPQGLLMPGGSFQAGTTFNSIKFIINPAKQKFHSAMRKIYQNRGQKLDTSKMLDIGHSEGAAVYDNKVSDALLSSGQIPPAAYAMEELAAILELQKNDKTNVISCTLESASKNRAHGQYLSQKSKHFDQLIKKALERLPSLALTKGSDTPVERTGKKAAKSILKEFKKIKSLDVQIKEDDLKLEEKTTLAQLKLKRKITGSKKGVKPKGAKTQGSKGPASAPLQLVASLNKRLPEVVQKNMKPPALEYQTGRFAESVQVTDVSTTNKGFPSVGYTYDRENYGQFEASSGTRFADPDRDPRKLIDASIREIARGMAIGRFFTRRT